MSSTPYQRADWRGLKRGGPSAAGPATPGASAPPGPADAPGTPPTSAVLGGAEPTPIAPSRAALLRARVRWSIIPISLALCVAQAATNILVDNIRYINITSTLIPVLGFGVMFIILLLINPLLKLVSLAFRGRIMRELSRAELTCVFCAMLVTAGVSTFGLADQLVPIIATPWNPEWNTPQRGWSEQLLPHLNEKLYITDPELIQAYRVGIRPTTPGGEVIPAPGGTAGWLAHFKYWGLIAREVPWGAWLSPLAYWLIFVGACYLLFYSLTYLVIGYWSQREKLIFPLAKLPEAILPAESEGGVREWVPAVFKQPTFWVGFLISGGLMSWNGVVRAGWLIGLTTIPFGMGQHGFNAIVQGSIFEGMGGTGYYSMGFVISFVAIGIAFLLPLEISFSIWFYFLLGKLMLLLGVWMNYGRTTNDFAADWLWDTNAMTGQGGGAMLMFSTIMLWRCVKEYVVMARGRSLRDSMQLLLPVLGLALSLITLTLWLQWNNIPWYWGLMVALFLTLLTLGLMRIVAEGGIYWLQSYASVFHSYKMLGLGKVLSPALMGPLLPIYSVLFLDLKTFMAPNLLNAVKMQQDEGAPRFKFHFNVLLCLTVTVVFSLLFSVLLCYIRGAQQMDGWFYSTGPSEAVMDIAQRATSAAPKFEPWSVLWYALGAVWVVVSMLARRTLFWFPHPIGYVMLMNPLITFLWFNFFLGWVCKKIVVKYGGKSTFDKVWYVFVGLILGHLAAVFFWPVCSMIFGFTTKGMDLNREFP